jgi:hypothetical protein
MVKGEAMSNEKDAAAQCEKDAMIAETFPATRRGVCRQIAALIREEGKKALTEKDYRFAELANRDEP